MPGVRIVSLAPNTTEALFALGLGKHVVGVSRYCDYPEQAKLLPRVGGFVDPSLEGILALQPDWVIGARSPSNRGVVKKLGARGIRTWFPTVERIPDVYALLRGIGDRWGRQAAANRMVLSMQRELSDIEKQYHKSRKPRVLLLFSEKPLSAAGPRSLGDAMISHAQAQNAIQSGSAYPMLGMEQLFSLAPDVIVLARHTTAPPRKMMLTESQYASLEAVQHGRILTLRDDRLLRPGPRIVEGIRVLARAIHGH